MGVGRALGSDAGNGSGTGCCSGCSGRHDGSYGMPAWLRAVKGQGSGSGDGTGAATLGHPPPIGRLCFPVMKLAQQLLVTN